MSTEEEGRGGPGKTAVKETRQTKKTKTYSILFITPRKQMDIPIAFMAFVVLGVLVSVFLMLKDSDLEPRTASLEVRTDNLEVNVDCLGFTATQSLAYLRKMNSTIDVLTDGMTLVVPEDPVLIGEVGAREEGEQQRGPRGVGREFEF